MAANGDQAGPTPHRWRLTISWAPTRPGFAGLHELMEPVMRTLSALDDGERGIVVHVGTLPEPADGDRTEG